MSRPEMMAIGDSLYNGVRSLTIDGDLANHSVPAQVARAFSWGFVSPDYRRPVLADFERMASHLGEAVNLRAACITNARQWLNSKDWSAHTVFHNLSIAQQVVLNPMHRCYNDSLARAIALTRLGKGIEIGVLPRLYQAINTCFILNPSQDPKRGSMSAVDIVAELNPKRLLVNLGINDGLFLLLLTSDGSNYSTIDFSTKMANLIAELATKCGGVEHFYINLMPKPSAIANLMPLDWSDGPAAGYFGTYKSYLYGASGTIPGELMQQIDTWVNDILNQKIRDACAGVGAKAHFVDLFALTAKHDFKNGLESPDD